MVCMFEARTRCMVCIFQLGVRTCDISLTRLDQLTMGEYQRFLLCRIGQVFGVSRSNLGQEAVGRVRVAAVGYTRNVVYI
jgi:hypothetical protein